MERLARVLTALAVVFIAGVANGQTIPHLPPASSVNASDLLPISQSAVTRSITVNQLLNYKASAAPCDQITGGCSGAWSMNRLMRLAYSGSLFEVLRASDSATLNVGVTAYGVVNTSAIATFCLATTCTVPVIYDQSGSNNIAQPTAANQPTVVIGENGYVYLAFTESQWMEQDTTSGLPTGSASKTLSMVSRVTWSRCCAGFSMTENPAATDGGLAEPGQMFGVFYGTGTGTWSFGVDVEQAVPSAYVTPFNGIGYGTIKYNSSSNTLAAILNGNTIFSAMAPGQTINTGSRLALGVAGDKTPVPMNFYEGLIVSKVTSASEDVAVYNSQVGFYSGGVRELPSQVIGQCDAVVCGYLTSPYSDTGLLFANTSAAAHLWLMESDGTGSGAAGGAGGLTLRDSTAGTDVLWLQPYSASAKGGSNEPLMIKGIADASNPTAGYIGEEIESSVSCSTTGLTSGTAANAVSISLTAGDWDVEGNLGVSLANTTVSTYVAGGISLTSATLPAAGNARFDEPVSYTSPGSGTDRVFATGKLRVNVSSTTTVYGVVFSNFTTSTAGPCGVIKARRIR